MPTIDYEITDVDYWEQDALLKIGDHVLYFQFNDTTKPPTIDDALTSIKNDSKYSAEND